VVRQEQEKRCVSVPTVIGPRSASLFEVAQLEQEERYLCSVGIRQGVAGIVGMYRALAIGGPSEVSILDRCPNHMTSKRNEVVRELLDKHLMLLPISLLVSAALVVLLVLQRANLLSIAAAVN